MKWHPGRRPQKARGPLDYSKIRWPRLLFSGACASLAKTISVASGAAAAKAVSLLDKQVGKPQSSSPVQILNCPPKRGRSNLELVLEQCRVAKGYYPNQT